VSMNSERIASVLRGTDLFGVLDEPALLRLAERAQYRRVPKGQTIFVQDEPGESLYVLAEGLVKLLLHSAQGDVVELGRVWPGLVFGHVAPLAQQHRSSSAETAAASVLISLRRDDVLPLVYSDQKFIDAVLRSLGGLILRADMQAVDQVFLTLPAKVAKKLLELAGPNSSHDLELTQVELARMVGSTRQSVNQVLRDFERRAFIGREERIFKILDQKELRRLAQQ
jgi:CRP/FNR family cyclic AMP-dependent transcriptional regulator